MDFLVNHGEFLHRAIPAMKRLCAATVLITTGFFYGNCHAASAKTPLVVVEKAEIQSVVKQVPLSGTVISPKTAQLSTEISGRIKQINVDIGDKVKRGSPLLQLDREIEALNLKALKAASQQAQEELNEARRRYENGDRLRAQNHISQEEFEQRLARFKIAEATVQRRLAEEQKQQALVKRHTLLAPFNGVISQKLSEAGEWLDKGKAVLTLVAMDKLNIDFQVPQEYYPQMDRESHISITLDTQADRTLSGKIQAIVPVSDPKARTFLVRTKIKSATGITPGMSAQGMLRLNTGQAGVVVSRDAIIRYRDGRITVWVVHLDGEIPKVSEQAVKLGHSFNGKVAIVEGLRADAIVVVQGNESLKQGQTVRIHSSE